MQRKHFRLVSGQVMFKQGDDIAMMIVNGIVADEQENIGTLQISEAQKSLQVNLFERLGQTVEVIGVSILSWNYLGHMSDTEFHNLPQQVETIEPAGTA